eukprot:TRINITY_DN42716_c0_g1_i1.p1 TRINITY_DN42716_c0_g1~~TRINITY_DN42716_c0_g1_i1.p1  ORF type:complete len:373 (+),score=104.98 TRINITY_DN42716_c0_g1_i1:47-1165(+)
MKAALAGSRRLCSTKAPLITLLPGDGIGPEVLEQAVRVLECVGEFRLQEGLIGGASIDKTGGNPLTDETVEMCKKSDAVLLGAVGGPKWDTRKASEGRPEQGLLKIRKELNLFANLRPVKIFTPLLDSCPLRPELVTGADLLVVRELTGGLYFGPRREEDETGTAEDTLPYSIEEVQRIVRVAAAEAMNRKGRLLSVDKANVLASSRLWRRVATETVTKEFPKVALSHGLVDSVAMDLIKKPTAFDVIVTENLFGDILSDEASVLSGSLGLLPSASLGVAGTPGMYEPIHGSAPDIAGQGKANPIAIILSVAMMMRSSFGDNKKAQAIEDAVDAALAAGLRTPDLILPHESQSKAVGTKEMTDFIVNHIKSC